MDRTTRNTLLLLAFILLIPALVVWWSITQTTARELESSAAATALKNIELEENFTDIDGNPANLEEHLGSIIVAHSWATWVPTSPTSLKNLLYLQSEYKDQNVVVLAINRSEAPSIAQRYLEINDVEELNVVTDATDRYFTEIDGRTMPETVFYDPTGAVLVHKRGVMELAELEDTLQKIIARLDE